jgi:hypothetical protein
MQRKNEGTDGIYHAEKTEGLDGTSLQEWHTIHMKTESWMVYHSRENGGPGRYLSAGTTYHSLEI